MEYISYFVMTSILQMKRRVKCTVSDMICRRKTHQRTNYTFDLMNLDNNKRMELFRSTPEMESIRDNRHLITFLPVKKQCHRLQQTRYFSLADQPIGIITFINDAFIRNVVWCSIRIG